MAVPEEVKTAYRERRHELHLTGASAGEFIDKKDGVLPEEITKISKLNFLEITGTSLTTVPANLCNLTLLTNLALFGNKLENVDESIGELSKLKFIDFSKNCLVKLPDALSKLTQLQTLNVSQNQLSDLPDLSDAYLVHLDASYNAFAALPGWLGTDKLSHLWDVDFSHNQVVELPFNLSLLPALKTLNLEENLIQIVPGEMADAPKLKELLLKNNKLKDNRLRKLVDGKPKSVLEYVRKNCPKAGGGAPGARKGAKKAATVSTSSGDAPSGVAKDTILVQPAATDLMISVMNNLTKIRPFIVCCILHNVDLTEDKMKQFITVQNKLHDGICKKRVAATIATHDLSLVQAPLVFAARSPDEIQMRPLNRKKDVSGREYVDLLKDEAEKRRKELKRTSYSGVHHFFYGTLSTAQLSKPHVLLQAVWSIARYSRYLSLLRPWQRYPCLIDREDVVISFPPITNSDVTRISHDTKRILVEVTSSESLNVCKEVMDKLLVDTLQLGIGSLRPQARVTEADFPSLPQNGPAAADEMSRALQKLDLSESEIGNVLVVEQCKVLAEDDSLKVCYPAKPDLAGVPNGVEVRRCF